MTFPTYIYPSALHILTAHYANGSTRTSAVCNQDEIELEIERLLLPRPVQVDSWKRRGMEWYKEGQTWR